MAIVPLDRVSICGTSDQKDAVLDGLQQLGCLHLIPLQKDPTQVADLVSHEAREALRYLATSPIMRRQSVSQDEFDQQRLIEEILEIKERRTELTAELESVRQAIADLKPWGEFRLPATGGIGNEQFWFYVVPLRNLPQWPKDVVSHVAGKDLQFAYVVVLAPEPPAQIVQKPVELDPHPLSELRQRAEGIEEELEELHWRRVALTRWHTLLAHDLDAADDRTARMAAAGGTWEGQPLFAVQGWIPRSAVPDVCALAQRHQAAALFEPPTTEDQPPTLLKNPDRLAGAEGCVTFYITPNYRAWDPTTVVFFSFSLFYAMIVSDAGYGLVMAGLLWLAWRKLGRTREARQGRTLLLGIVAATIVYGVIVGSYFGVTPSPDSILGKLQVRVGGRPLMENQEVMMGLAVAIGVAHIVLANLISMWRCRRSTRAVGHLGWALIILGAFLLLVGTRTAGSLVEDAGGVLCVAGFVAVLFFSSDVPWGTRSVQGHWRRLLDGVMQMTNVSKALGDVLSYLRLFALGLAGAQLAMTFNGLAGNASEVGGLGILLAILLLVVGHSINFILGIMGGVVHGLRLNCIEFFNWSLTEEGSAFQPFQKKAGDPWTIS